LEGSTKKVYAKEGFPEPMPGVLVHSEWGAELAVAVQALENRVNIVYLSVFLEEDNRVDVSIKQVWYNLEGFPMWDPNVLPAPA
jgi:hypothetical protein